MTSIDRVAPTRRPEGANAGTQNWRELLFAHWSFDPAIVRALVPDVLDLDLWDGRAWVGLVPFKMEEIRPSFIPRALALDFLETNLRTYVTHRGEPGVWFFSLEASSRLAVKAARMMWGLPYFHAEMRATKEGDRLRYTSRRNGSLADLDVEWEIGEVLGPSKVGTFEHFLLERYLLFAMKNGTVKKGHVHHVPYPAQRAKVHRIQESLLAAAGLPAPVDAPEIVHYASGVDVEVFGPWDITS
jgi:uncharacterized protein YqjF (DUF2071 family)